MNLTPLEFYRKFGHETASYYIRGIILLNDNFKNWNVDKAELRNIVELVEAIEEYDISDLEDFLKENDSKAYFEIWVDGGPQMWNIEQAKENLDRYKEIKEFCK